MDSATRRRGQGGLFEGIYRVIMRRNSVYVTFVIAGAFLGERAVDYGVHRLWEMNNVGFVLLAAGFIWNLLGGIRDFSYGAFSKAKRYEDISVLGQRQSEE